MEVSENPIAGMFQKFISENTSIPVFGNELPNCIRSSNFLVFYFVSHINQFQLFTGTCQATNQHASDRVGRPKTASATQGVSVLICKYFIFNAFVYCACFFEVCVHAFCFTSFVL